MTDRDLDACHILPEAIHRSFPTAMILVTGLFQRQDVPPELVEDSNRKIKGLVDVLGEMKKWKICFLPATSAVSVPMASNTGKHFADHVHLNKDGYDIWDGDLCPVVESLLAGAGPLRAPKSE